MSFREFKDELLLALVLEAEASTTKQLVPQTVASKRGLNFREGWLRQAVKSLDDSGLVRASFFIGGGPEGGMSLTITGDGLEQAEELASNSGFDLYE